MTESMHHWNPDEGDLCQGDVLLFRLPKGVTPGRTDRILARDGKLFLAEGEITGHYHAVWFNPPMFRDDSLARTMEAQDHPASAALYRDDALVGRLVADGLLTTRELAIGFLTVEGGAVILRHQEHDPIRIPPGDYYVGRQQEFSAGSTRQVAD